MSYPLRFVSSLLDDNVEIRGIECIICMEKLSPVDTYYIPCGHCFHRKCIRTWLIGRQLCPHCRKPLTDLFQVRRIHFLTPLDNHDDLYLRELNDEFKNLCLKMNLTKQKIQYEQETAPKLSEDELKNRIENMKEQLSHYGSVQNIVSASRQDERLPNDIELLKRHIIQIQRELANSIKVEHENQRMLTAKLNLELENTRKWENALKEYEQEEQLQAQKIKELSKNFLVSKVITSTPKKIESQVSEIIASPDEPIARRTRNRLQNRRR